MAGLYALAAWRWRPAGAAPPSSGQKLCFGLAALTILVALFTPLDLLSDEYLFSAHMVQHLLLVMVMPTLLLLSFPRWMVDPVLSIGLIRRVVRLLGWAPLSFAAFNIAFAASHAPFVYEATLRDPLVHALEHLGFMVLGLASWLPVLSPTPQLPRLAPPLQVLYLFLNTFPMMMVGAMLTDASSAVYPTYAAAPRVLGISVMADQQAGGLLMWIGGSLYYLVVLSVVFFRWAFAEEAKEPPVPSPAAPRPARQTR